MNMFEPYRNMTPKYDPATALMMILYHPVQPAPTPRCRIYISTQIWIRRLTCYLSSAKLGQIIIRELEKEGSVNQSVMIFVMPVATQQPPCQFIINTL